TTSPGIIYGSVLIHFINITRFHTIPQHQSILIIFILPESIYKKLSRRLIKMSTSRSKVLQLLSSFVKRWKSCQSPKTNWETSRTPALAKQRRTANSLFEQTLTTFALLTEGVRFLCIN